MIDVPCCLEEDPGMPVTRYMGRGSGQPALNPDIRGGDGAGGVGGYVEKEDAGSRVSAGICVDPIREAEGRDQGRDVRASEIGR